MRLNVSSDQSSQSENNYLFGVAGLNTLVSCNNKDLILGLNERYSAFDSQGEVLLNVKIEHIGQQHASSALDKGTRFTNGICHFHGSGFDGFIDSKRGIGELIFSSQHPIDEVDYFLRVAYALLSFDSGGLMLHAAGIVRNRLAYLFFGHSGAGKTTVARVSKDDLVLNDDLLILMPRSSYGDHSSSWFAYATPFWNPSQVTPTNQSAPAIGFYRLVQDKEVYVELLGPAQALGELVSNVPVIPADMSRGEELLKRVEKLIKQISVKRLHFLPDSSFWEVIYVGNEPDRVDS